jgi:hypothetical protein
MKTKRTILTAVFYSLCLLATSHAQLVYDDAPKHLMFNNIPMNGDISLFVEKLVKQGFTSQGNSGTLVDLSGELYGKECSLTVMGTEKTKNVYDITVYFILNERNWLTFKKEYLELKKIYQAKYGIGNSIEYFSEPYKEGDGKEIDALKDMKCNYSTEWKSGSGRIYMLISYDGQTTIKFTDITNELKQKNEKTNDAEW